MTAYDWRDDWKVKVGVGLLAVGAVILKRARGVSVYSKMPVKMLNHHVAIVTGGNSGIGQSTAYTLANMKMTVILTAKDLQSAERAAEEIRQSEENVNIVGMACDLSSFDSIRKFVKDVDAFYPRIDVLVNNAAVCMCPYSKTKDGLEMQMGVNYFGHFLLTNLLLRKMADPINKSRIVFVSSPLAKRGELDFDNLNSELEYSKESAYYNSKLAINIFSVELAKRILPYGVRVYCVRPGLTRTNLARHVNLPIWEKVAITFLSKGTLLGCQTVVHCATADEAENETGQYYANCMKINWPGEMLKYKDDGAKLWQVSKEITKLEQTV